MADGPFFLTPELLEPLADKLAGDFAGAAPFPHVIIDDFLPADVLREVVGEFPAPGEHPDWIRSKRDTSVKLTEPRDWVLGPVTRQVLNQLNTALFVDWLERVTGIDGLVPDPHYFGGGLHQIERGGYLKVHADFNNHPRLRLDRRLNLLLYLNEGWDPAWGGQLELWERDMSRCARRVDPVFGRCVIFATTDFSFHGHPDPLACPEGVTRRSLALYYYSNGRPEEERTEEGEHSTLYQARPGETFVPPETVTEQPTVQQSRLKRVVRDVTPPIVLRAAKRLRQR